MKKIYLIPLALIVVMIFSALMYENLHRKKELYKPLLERSGPISTTSEWKNTKASIYALQDQIKQNPGNLKNKLLLSLAYMQEARVTGEHPYYYPAALELLEEIISEDSEDASVRYEAIVAKASVLLSLHQFEEAKKVGKLALEMNANSASVYGVLCDANVETGHYEEATKMADKMASIRPDIRSYARISYLREIYGDMPGAVEAMKLAASAGYPGLEQTAWTRVTLGQLYERCGDLQNASYQYNQALAEYPNYAFAIGGLGSVEEKKGNDAGAVELYIKAGKIIPEFSFKENLVSLYKKTGKLKESAAAAEELLVMLKEDTDAGHNVDLELSNIYRDIFKDYDKALEYAEKESERRPENIDVCKALAHVMYLKGDLINATEYLNQATRTHKKNSELLCLHGLIKIRSNQKAEGLKLIKQSFELDPFQNGILSADAKKMLSLN